MAHDRFLSLISPATGNKEVFHWFPCDTSDVKEENSEAIEVLNWLATDIEELSKNEELSKLLKNVDKNCYNSVSNLCSVYNRLVVDLFKQWESLPTQPEFLSRKATKDHVQFILNQCYNRAVAEPDKLNQYPPFSAQVYGETSFELISQMIDTVDITCEDTFIDLGSGVGQVVLQVAACSDAKSCYGIEKADYPSACAFKLDNEFRHWMAFYGKPYRPYRLERGDFLSADYQERICSASVLFANNFAFGPEVDHQLKQRFANLKEGARVISSKAFCPLNFRITDRNLGDIGSIMRLSCLNPIQDAVSWTDKPFRYYVHTIDRSLLERYFSRLKNPKLQDDGDVVRRDRNGRIICEPSLKDSNNTENLQPSSKLRNGNSSVPNGVGKRSRSLVSVRNIGRRSKSFNSSLNSSAKVAASETECCQRVRRSIKRFSRRSLTAMRSRKGDKKTIIDSSSNSRTVKQRTSTLSPTSSIQNDSISRSSSFPTIRTNAENSGHTTPMSSTSASSAFSTDEFCLRKKSVILGNTCCSPLVSVDDSSEYRNCWTSSSPSLISSSAARSPALVSDETLVPPSSECHLADSGTTRTPPIYSPVDYLKTSPGILAHQSPDTSVAARRAVRKCRQPPPPAPSLLTDQLQVTKKSRTVAHGLRSLRRRNPRAGRLQSTGRRFQTSKNKTPINKQRLNRAAHLNLLHQETVTKMDVKLCSEPKVFGRNDPDMAYFTCHYQPREIRSLNEAAFHAESTSTDPHIGHSDQPVPLSLTQYLELLKRKFMDHFALLNSTTYLSEMRRQLAYEEARRDILLKRTQVAEAAINQLHSDGTALLDQIAKQLGLAISTPSAFFSQARKLIKHHHSLESKVSEIRKQINELSTSNQELVRLHQAEAERLLSTALTATGNCAAYPNHLLGTVSHFSDNPDASLLANALANIPPPPILTKTNHSSVHPSTSYPSTSCSKSHHRYRSIAPLLHPQTTLTRPTSGTVHKGPPVLQPTDDPLRSSPHIPPPPPLLPMNPRPPPTKYHSATSYNSVYPISISNFTSTPASTPVFQSSKTVHTSLQNLIAEEIDRQTALTTSPTSASVPILPIITSAVSVNALPVNTYSTLPPRKRNFHHLLTQDLTDPAIKYPRHESPHSQHSSPPTLSPVTSRTHLPRLDWDDNTTPPKCIALGSFHSTVTTSTVTSAFSSPNSIHQHQQQHYTLPPVLHSTESHMSPLISRPSRSGSLHHSSLSPSLSKTPVPLEQTVGP